MPLKLAKKVIARCRHQGRQMTERTQQALFFHERRPRPKALAELAVEDCKDKKQYKEALKDGSLCGHGAVWPHGGR